MSNMIKKVRDEEGTIVFKAASPQDGDIIIKERKSTKPKGKTISGAAKMKAAYKARKSSKSKKK